jgi:hypothetical protein
VRRKEREEERKEEIRRVKEEEKERRQQVRGVAQPSFGRRVLPSVEPHRKREASALPSRNTKRPRAGQRTPREDAKTI